MKHLYLCTLEIAPLEVGRVYKNLPPHLTLMSRFLAGLSPVELSNIVQPLFEQTPAVDLVFEKTIQLGPNKVTAHMVHSPQEMQLHMQLNELLNQIDAEPQYPQFIGKNHRAHVTKREGAHFNNGDRRRSSAVYLIEVVNGSRVVRAKFVLK